MSGMRGILRVNQRANNVRQRFSTDDFENFHLFPLRGDRDVCTHNRRISPDNLMEREELAYISAISVGKWASQSLHIQDFPEARVLDYPIRSMPLGTFHADDVNTGLHNTRRLVGIGILHVISCFIEVYRLRTWAFLKTTSKSHSHQCPIITVQLPKTFVTLRAI